MAELESAIREQASKGDVVIFIVSMCVPGIIGDNIIDLSAKMSRELGIKVVPLPVDGIGVGGAISGRELAIDEIIKLIEPCEHKDPGLINVIGEYRSRREFFSYLDESLEELFSSAGLKVNTIYPGRCSLDDIRNMGRAAFAVSSQEDTTFAPSARKLCQASGSILMSEPLPKSMSSIERWMDEMSEIKGIDLSVMKSEFRRRYDEGIGRIRVRTKGKKVMVITHPINNRDWLYELLDDLGISVLSERTMPVNRWASGTQSSESYSPYTLEDAMSDIDLLKPDLVLTDKQSDLYIGFRTGMIADVHPGLAGILDYAKRLGMMFETPLMESWRAGV
jgi:nitrogenase molybdenum-iron protein alpha/beta subunit